MTEEEERPIQEEDAIVETPEGTRWKAQEIDRTGEISDEDS